jgi:hypothetical protein
MSAKKEDIESPHASSPLLLSSPPLPEGMLGNTDEAAKAQMIPLADLSSEDKRALWKRLKGEMPDFASGMQAYVHAFGGQSVRLNLRAHDPAMHEHFRSRAK